MGLRTKYFLLGAVAFWTPDVLLAAVFHQPSIERWYLANPIFVISVCLTYAAIFKLRASRYPPSNISAAFYMLIGIYVLAPEFMLIEQTFAFSRIPAFHTMQDWGYMMLSSFLPPYTLIMAGYDGSAFALLIVTVLLIVADQTLEKHRRRTAISDT
jgi:hypothetical protein